MKPNWFLQPLQFLALRCSPNRPASWSWIFNISIGVVTTTWHVPAPQPASISLANDNSFLLRIAQRYRTSSKGQMETMLRLEQDYKQRTNALFPIPVHGEQLSEEIIGCQLDRLFRSDKSEVYSSPLERTEEALRSLDGDFTGSTLLPTGNADCFHMQIKIHKSNNI